MARQTINIGTNANDGTGDPLRTAFDKINDNFLELYGTDGDANTLQANLDINGFNIVSTRSNEDIRIIPNGTGTIELEKSTNITGALTVSTTAGITGNATVGGTLGVTGLSTLASFKGATGATVTAILDEDTLSSNSDTALATQQSIKTYIDAQNTSQALTFVGDDSTGTAVNSGETFQIAGGTGLTSVVSGDTLTLDIDSTVATLTGTQILTNKTLTAPTINGATTTGTVTVATISPNGTDDITINMSNESATALVIKDENGPYLTFNTVGDSSSDRITLGRHLEAGNTKISGNLFDVNGGTIDSTPIGLTGRSGGNFTTVDANSSLTVNHVRISDQKITTYESNVDLQLDANGTGVVDVQAPLTTQAVTIGGAFTVSSPYVSTLGGLTFDGTSITAGTGITVTAGSGGSITLDGTRTVTNWVMADNVTTSSNLYTNTITGRTSNADLTITTQGTGQVVLNSVVKFNSGYVDAINALTSSSTITVDCNLAPVHTVTLATNTGFVITNLPAGGTVSLIIRQDATGLRTATFGTDTSTAVKFPSGAATLSTTANSIDVVTIFNDGTDYLGNIANSYS